MKYLYFLNLILLWFNHCTKLYHNTFFFFNCTVKTKKCRQSVDAASRHNILLSTTIQLLASNWFYGM